MDAPDDASVLKSPVRQVRIAAALQAATVIRGPDQTYATHKKRSWFTRSMTVCPCSPSDLAPDVQRKRRRTPGNSSVGSRRDRRRPIPSSSAAPRRCAPLASRRQLRRLGRERQPRPAPFRPRTTDMAPMLRHADSCRASPCRPCCLLPTLNRAKPRSCALSSPARRLPKRFRLQACSASSPRLPSPCCSAIFSFKPCFSGAQGGRRRQRKLPDVGSALRSCNAELRDREAPSGSAAARLRACHVIPCRSPVFTATNVGRDAASAPASAASFTLDEGLDAAATT